MKYYHSQAFKIHKALPESRYIFNIDMEDQIPEKDEDRFLSEMYKNKIIFIAEKSPKVAFFAFIM